MNWTRPGSPTHRPWPGTRLWPIRNRAMQAVGWHACTQLNLHEQWASMCVHKHMAQLAQVELCKHVCTHWPTTHTTWFPSLSPARMPSRKS